MYEVELKNISNEMKNKVIDFLESIDHNESFIVHFLQEADEQNEPEKYILKKYPELAE